MDWANRELNPWSVDTIFAQSDAAATIYFITQFCGASIREWLLIKSGYQLRVAFIKLSVIGKIFCKYEGFEKASFILWRKKNYDAVTWYCLNYILLNVEHQIAFNLDAMDIEWKCRRLCTSNSCLFQLLKFTSPVTATTTSVPKCST